MTDPRNAALEYFNGMIKCMDTQAPFSPESMAHIETIRACLATSPAPMPSAEVAAAQDRIMRTMCDTFRNGSIYQEARISAEDFATLITAAQASYAMGVEMVERLKVIASQKDENMHTVRALAWDAISMINEALTQPGEKS